MNSIIKRRAALPTTLQPTPRLTLCNSKICSPAPNTLNGAPVVAPNFDTMYGIAQLDLAQPLLLQVPTFTQPVPNTNNTVFLIGPNDFRWYGLTFFNAYNNVAGVVNRITFGGGGRFCLYTNPAQEAICNATALVGNFTFQAKLLLPRYVTAIVRAWSTGNTSTNPCVDPQTQLVNPGIDGCNFMEFMVFQNLTAAPPTLLAPFNEFKALLSPVAGSCGAASDGGIPCGHVGGNRNAYWDLVCKILKMSPPSVNESIYIDTHFGSLGINSTGNCNPHYDELNAGFDLGYEELASPENQSMTGVAKQGWMYLVFNGAWSLNAPSLYLRAMAAKRLFFMEPNNVAAYWAKFTDNIGDDLDGAGGVIYKITFPGGNVPVVTSPQPVGFWSMTVYGPDWFLHPNPTNKYNFHSRSGTPPTAIYLSTDCSGAPVGTGADCIPVPTGFFRLLFAGYVPMPALAPNGAYTLPDVQKCPIGSGYC